MRNSYETFLVNLGSVYQKSTKDQKSPSSNSSYIYSTLIKTTKTVQQCLSDFSLLFM